LAIERADGIPWQDVESLGRPDTEASEHLIWFFPEEGKVFKATAYGKFGHSIERGSGKNTDTQILRFLNEQGFKLDPLRAGVFVNQRIGIEVADAHPGNFIKSENGAIVPVDVLAFKFDQNKGIDFFGTRTEG
jgi:hypothetical protein